MTDEVGKRKTKLKRAEQLDYKNRSGASVEQRAEKLTTRMDIVVIMLDGTCCTVRVQPRDTVAHLKNLIMQSLGVQPENQTLMVDNGQRTTLSDDSKPLSFYGLHPGSTVSLLVTKPAVVQVFVRNEKGKISTYDVKLDLRVADFRKQVADREKVALTQLRLVHEGREMQDGNKLSDYNVTEHSTIDMTFRLRGGL